IPFPNLLQHSPVREESRDLEPAPVDESAAKISASSWLPMTTPSARSESTKPRNESEQERMQKVEKLGQKAEKLQAKAEKLREKADKLGLKTARPDNSLDDIVPAQVNSPTEQQPDPVDVREQSVSQVEEPTAQQKPKEQSKGLISEILSFFVQPPPE